MARLYANENFPLPVVLELRRLGHDVLTTQEAGKSNQAISDEDVLTFACAETRAVLTLNRKHFLACIKPSRSIRASLYAPTTRTFWTKPRVLMPPFKSSRCWKVNSCG